MTSPEPQAPGGSARPERPASLWLIALAVGLPCGLAGGLVGETVYGTFQPQVILPANFNTLGMFEKGAMRDSLTGRAQPAAAAKNAALAFGGLGALLGAALGLAGGLSGRGPAAARNAAALGVAAGGVTGAVAALAVSPLYFRYRDEPSPSLLLVVPMLTHLGLWAPIGAAAGLAFGLGHSGRAALARAALGGLTGAALGALGFEILNALAFPLAQVDEPLPSERLPRLLAHLLVAAGAALGSALAIQPPARRGAPGSPGD